MKDMFHFTVLVLVLLVGAVLPLVGGILFVICAALGLVDINL